MSTLKSKLVLIPFAFDLIYNCTYEITIFNLSSSFYSVKFPVLILYAAKLDNNHIENDKPYFMPQIRLTSKIYVLWKQCYLHHELSKYSMSSLYFYFTMYIYNVQYYCALLLGLQELKDRDKCQHEVFLDLCNNGHEFTKENLIIMKIIFKYWLLSMFKIIWTFAPHLYLISNLSTL